MCNDILICTSQGFKLSMGFLETFCYCLPNYHNPLTSHSGLYKQIHTHIPLCSVCAFYICCTESTDYSLSLYHVCVCLCSHHSQAVRQVCYHRKHPLFASCSDDGSAIVCHGMVYRYTGKGGWE